MMTIRALLPGLAAFLLLSIHTPVLAADTTSATQSADTPTSATVADEPTTAARAAREIVARANRTIASLGPYELVTIVTPLHLGVADNPSTRTFWVLREGEFLGRVEGRTGLQMFIRNAERIGFNPQNNRYHRWWSTMPEPPISPEGQAKYLIDEAELVQRIEDLDGLGPVWHLRTEDRPGIYLDAYYSAESNLPVRYESVSTNTTIREDMIYRANPSLTEADMTPKLPEGAVEVKTGDELR